jgi:hypothetical protein
MVTRRKSDGWWNKRMNTTPWSQAATIVVLLFCGCVQSCHIAFVMAYRFEYYIGTFRFNDLTFSLGPQDTVLGPSLCHISHG